MTDPSFEQMQVRAVVGRGDLRRYWVKLPGQDWKEIGRGQYRTLRTKLDRRRNKGVGKNLRRKILARDDYACTNPACSSGRRDPAVLEIDHIVPVSEGGTDYPSNLRTLCATCHDERHHDEA